LVLGGICVILKQDVKIFSPVEIEVDLLDLAHHVKCKGKVVWNVQRKGDTKKKPLSFDIGIEFDNIGDKESERIEAIVSRLVKEHGALP